MGRAVLTLRLVPVFPFRLIKLSMGLTPMGAGRFYLVSQLGMLAGTAACVNAGAQLAAIQSPGDTPSPGLLGSFVLLGLFPLLAKAGVGWLRRRKVHAKWPKPARFDRNPVVIGAGAGGLVSACIAEAVKAKVTLIEGHRMGGDCLNFGCAPSKALIRSAKMAKQLRKAHELGFADAAGRMDVAAVMRRVHGVIHDIEPHDSLERYASLGVEVLQGHARITGHWSVEVLLADGTRQMLTTRNIVIAAGASPFVPPIPGLKDVGCLTSDTVWGLTELPERLVVLGGGPIGSELAQSFARLGSTVTQVETAVRCGPQPACHWLRARRTRHPADAEEDDRDQHLPADAVPEHLGLLAQNPPPTRYRVHELHGRRVDTPLTGVGLRSKESDAAALEACALFEMPRERVPFVERQLLRLAESRFGEPLPNAPLCDVWDPSWPRGSVVPNAYTKRVRFITLDGAAGAWLSERRDLSADVLRAFGDEAREVPPLRAILVGADADNSSGRSAGWVDALRLEPVPAR